MAGSFRCERVVSRSGRLAVEGVYSGHLTDADGTRIGAASRWASAPARAERDQGGRSVVVDSLEVDLLGLDVWVDSVTMPWPDDPQTSAAGGPSPHPNDGPDIRGAP